MDPGAQLGYDDHGTKGRLLSEEMPTRPPLRDACRFSRNPHQQEEVLMPELPKGQALMQLLGAGDEEAARQVVDRYIDRLVALARQRLSQRLASRVDPEDVVQSVFRTFFVRVRAGQFHIADQDD